MAVVWPINYWFNKRKIFIFTDLSQFGKDVGVCNFIINDFDTGILK